MQSLDALLQRRSAKTLTAPAPDVGALELILASAAAAPDHGRLRPWRFIVIEGDSLGRFGDLLAAHLRRRSQYFAGAIEPRAARNHSGAEADTSD